MRTAVLAASMALLTFAASAQAPSAANNPAPSDNSPAAAAELDAQKVLEARRLAYGSEEPVDVSMLQLIATPEKYQGKLVRAIAFLRIEFEGNALYLHKEDYDHRIAKNAIWLQLSHDAMLKAEGISNQYVIVEGHFDGQQKGHMGLFSGTLSDVIRLDPWKLKAPSTQPRIPSYQLPDTAPDQH